MNRAQELISLAETGGGDVWDNNVKQAIQKVAADGKITYNQVVSIATNFEGGGTRGFRSDVISSVMNLAKGLGLTVVYV